MESLLDQWLFSKGITNPTLEDILEASDEIEEFFNEGFYEEE